MVPIDRIYSAYAHIRKLEDVAEPTPATASAIFEHQGDLEHAGGPRYVAEEAAAAKRDCRTGERYEALPVKLILKSGAGGAERPGSGGRLVRRWFQTVPGASFVGPDLSGRFSFSLPKASRPVWTHKERDASVGTRVRRGAFLAPQSPKAPVGAGARQLPGLRQDRLSTRGLTDNRQPTNPTTDNQQAATSPL